jgi:hypothetical protein
MNRQEENEIWLRIREAMKSPSERRFRRYKPPVRNPQSAIVLLADRFRRQLVVSTLEGETPRDKQQAQA